MDCHNNISSLKEWYIQCPRNEIYWITVYELKWFRRDATDRYIWIRPTDAIEWCQYNSLYFSNGVVGVYDPSDVYYDSPLRIEFENIQDASTIESGLCFSFLNQFEFGIENNEVIEGIKYIDKAIKH